MCVRAVRVRAVFVRAVCVRAVFVRAVFVTAVCVRAVCVRAVQCVTVSNFSRMYMYIHVRQVCVGRPGNEANS